MHNKLSQADEFNLRSLLKNLREFERKTTHSNKNYYHIYPPYKCTCIFC